MFLPSFPSSAKTVAFSPVNGFLASTKTLTSSTNRVFVGQKRLFCIRKWAASAAIEDKQEAAKDENNAALQPFHLAFPVSSISAAKEFYGSKMGCQEGRSATSWVDYSLFGHQIVCHEVKGYNAASIHNAVDGDPVPVPHFGLALTPSQFHSLAEQVKSSGIEFVLKPHLRFEGQPGEQWTMFFKDPSGNALEFKAMTNPENLFAKYFVS